MISKWKKEFLENAANAFGGTKESKPEVATEKLYTQIGELTIQVNFLKKAWRKPVCKRSQRLGFLEEYNECPQTVCYAFCEPKQFVLPS